MAAKCNALSEMDSLRFLAEIYLSHTSKWYASTIATFVGAFGIPLLVFNIRISMNKDIMGIYLHMFSLLTIIFLLMTLYFLHKVVYSLQFLEEIYNKTLVDSQPNKNLIEFRNEIMNFLKKRSIIFKNLVRRNKMDINSYKQHNLIYISSIVAAIFGGVILLSLIWIPFNLNWKSILCWDVAYLSLLLTYLIIKPI